MSSSGGFGQPPQHELFDAHSGKRIRDLEPQAQHRDVAVRTLAFSSDGSMIAGVGHGSEVFFWESATGKRSPGASGPAYQVQGVVFASGRSYAFGSSGFDVQVWDARTGELVRPVSGHTGPVGSVAFLPPGRQIISEARGGEIRIWDGSDGHMVHGYFLEANSPRGNLAGPCIARVSPAGKFIFSWKFRATEGRLFDASSGRALRGVRTTGSRDPVLAFSADDQLLLIQSQGPKQGADLYDTSTAKLLRHFATGGGELINVAVSADHRLVALAAGTGQQNLNRLVPSEVRVFDAESGDARCSLAARSYAYGLLPLAFGPDGDYVMLQSIDPPVSELVLCDSRSGKRICALPFNWFSFPPCLRISPDGRTIAAVTQDHRNSRSIIEVWEVCSASTREKLDLGRALVSTLAFSPDGRKLAAGCQDSTVLVWDLAEKLRDGPQSISSEAKSALWTELASADARRAYQAMTKLYTAPGDAVDVIRSNLKAVTAKTPTQEEIAGLLRKLDSPRFRERAQASAELSGLGESAIPLLRKALDSEQSAEVRARLAQSLESITRIRFAPEMMRPLRALEVLEHINSSESRAALKAYAAGSADAPLTKYARGSLERLARAAADK